MISRLFVYSLGFLSATAPILANDGVSGAACAAPYLSNWPQWRGPLGNGVTPQANPPIHWSETNNIRWRFPLPGQGHSSPIVFGNAIYVLAAAPVGPAQKPVYDDAPGVHDSVPVTHRFQFIALALSRAEGKLLWQKILREEWPLLFARLKRMNLDLGTLMKSAPTNGAQS